MFVTKARDYELLNAIAYHFEQLAVRADWEAMKAKSPAKRREHEASARYLRASAMRVREVRLI
jgi:hypothetical protein